MTKLDDEMRSFVDAAKNWRGIISSGYKSNPPPIWLTNGIDKIVTSELTVWFCAGLALEAAGITVQMFLRIDTYPIMDALVAGAIAIGLWAYQRRISKGDS